MPDASHTIDFSEVIKKYTERVGLLLKYAGFRLDSATDNISAEGGIYRLYFYDDFKDTLYVGESGNLRERICYNLLAVNHTFCKKLFAAYHHDSAEDARDFLERNIACQVLPVRDERQRILLEHFAIAVLKPTLNDKGSLLDQE